RRLDAALDQMDDRLARTPAVRALRVRDGLLSRAVREAQAERLERRCHRVRGVHARAGTGPRNRRRLDLLELGLADPAGRVRADRLEHGDDVATLRPRLNRTAVDENRRPVEPGYRHRAARDVLVAAADRDEAVEPLARDDRLDRVRDHFA